MACASSMTTYLLPPSSGSWMGGLYVVEVWTTGGRRYLIIKCPSVYHIATAHEPSLRQGWWSQQIGHGPYRLGRAIGELAPTRATALDPLAGVAAKERTHSRSWRLAKHTAASPQSAVLPSEVPSQKSLHVPSLYIDTVTGP